MGREIRLIPPGWEHPRNEQGHLIPLLKGPFSAALAEWEEGNAHWQAGEIRNRWVDGVAWQPKPEAALASAAYEQWNGARPVAADYMPEWADGEATLLVMYESTTEGTPISPAFETPEELARWLADNGASAFGGMTATYEEWLATCRRGWAPAGALIDGAIMSGVEALA